MTEHEGRLRDFEYRSGIGVCDEDYDEDEELDITNDSDSKKQQTPV